MTQLYTVYKKLNSNIMIWVSWKWKDEKKLYYVNIIREDILIPDKIDFLVKKITRDTEGHYIMIHPLKNSLPVYFKEYPKKYFILWCSNCTPQHLS